MITLSRGLNPHETARAEAAVPGCVPFEHLSGSISYINALDAAAGWELVLDAARETGEVACAALKHTSPVGVSLGAPIRDTERGLYENEPPPDPVAYAIARTRAVSPKCSRGDMVAVSAPLTEAHVALLGHAIGVIAPDYAPGVVDLLRLGNHGNFIVLRGSPDLVAPTRAVQEAHGLRLERTLVAADRFLGGLTVLSGTMPSRRDVVVAALATKHAQSNSMVLALDGQTIGIGMGQQNRLDSTQLALGRARTWHRRRHPTVHNMVFRPEVSADARAMWRERVAADDLTEWAAAELLAALPAGTPLPAVDFTTQPPLTGTTLAADNTFPFVEIIERAAKFGVVQLVAPYAGGLAPEVIAACEEYGINWIATGERLFKH